ncbi:LOW QUALITY PROTEIN: long-chain-fatty-acid-CoA ligase [Bacillus sp. JCM 19046]|nr:LOW QUALITY PROTEIN: long-chain-fatty-acid-CoA ligase [Bacillus sp. JCM 19046]
MNSAQFVSRNARKYPNTMAIHSPLRAYTYAQLETEVNGLANALLNLSIKQGDRVCLFIPNTPAFISSYFAVQRIGAIVVPINAKFTLEEVQHVINHAEPSCIIVDDALFPVVASVSNVPLKIKTGSPSSDWKHFETLIAEASHADIHIPLTEDDLSTILYTSGTTGDPKGVLFSYRNILTVAQMIAVELEVKPESKLLIMMPLTHSAPLHLFLMAGIITGSTIVITPTFSPDQLLEAVSKQKTTHFFGAPVAYLMTANHPSLSEYDLSSMNWWVYGGAPLAKDQIDFIEQKLNTKRLTCVYGLTEAGPSGSIYYPKNMAKKPGSIGKRAPLHTELRIVTNDGDDVPIGEIGEIVLAGEGNMVGYYRNEQATKAAFIGEWLKTGDLARRDQDGYIYVVDRKRDVIISGGVNIYPKEIEDVLVTYDSIQEAAIIGIPHPEWGETVTAYFSAAETIDVEAVKQFLQLHLAAFKIPRIFEQVKQLPRNASGKILKRALKEGVKEA